MKDINIFSYEFCQNRFQHYKNFKESGNIVYSPLSNCWLIIGYKEVEEVLSDYKRFSLVPVYQEFDSVMGTDMPEHSKNKQVFKKHLDALGSANPHQNYIDQFELIAKKLVERLRLLESFDMIRDFIVPYSISVGFLILKLEKMSPVHDILLPENELEFVISELNDLNENFGFAETTLLLKLIRNYGTESTDSVLRKIILDSGIHPEYELDELIKTFRTLSIVGVDSSIGLLSNAIYTLLTDAGIYHQVSSDFNNRSLAFINESLRYNTSVQTVIRIALEDCEIADTKLKKGDPIAVLVGAANRDPAIFSDPEKFDIHRNNQAILSYGKGIHFCMGYHVSKIMASIALKELMELLGNLKLSGQEIEYSHSPMIMKIARIDLSRK